MRVPTGYTVNTIVLSIDSNNNPYSAATFNIEMFQNGFPTTGATASSTISDPVTGAFNIFWSASTIGDYQFYAYNNTTGAIFVSDIVNVLPDLAFQTNIYVGL